MAPRLERVRPGTRLRLFHVDGGDRVATSGTVLSVGPDRLRMTSDEGGEIVVALEDVTCFYVPKPIGAGARSLRALLGRLFRRPRPHPEGGRTAGRPPREAPDRPADAPRDRPADADRELADVVA